MVGAMTACATVSLPWPFRTTPAAPLQHPVPGNAPPSPAPAGPAEAALHSRETHQRTSGVRGAGEAESSQPTERLALVFGHKIPQVEFSSPDRIEPQAPRIMEESIKAGALVGAIPLMACAVTYLCTPDALVAGAALLVAGTAAGIVIGAGRVLATGNHPSQLRALAPHDIETATPIIQAAANRFLGSEALYKCMLKNLAADAAKKSEAARWMHESRTVDVSLKSGLGPAERPMNRGTDAFQYVGEAFVSRVAVMPVGSAVQDSPEVPIRLLVEGGFRFLDRAADRVHERQLEWHSDPHALSAWRSERNGSLAQSLLLACESLAAQMATAAENNLA
jgi:hypothetical protein